MRYPKASVGADIPAVRRVGHFDVLRSDPDAEVLLVAVGPLAGPCLAAAEELAAHDVRVTVVDPRWIAPLDPHLVKYCGQHRLVLAVEDTTSTGASGFAAGPGADRYVDAVWRLSRYHRVSCRTTLAPASCARTAWTRPASRRAC